MPVHLAKYILLQFLRQCLWGMVQGTLVPASPVLLANMQLLGSFSRITEPESLGAAVDSRFSTGPPGGPYNNCKVRTTAQGRVPGLSSSSFTWEDGSKLLKRVHISMWWLNCPAKIPYAAAWASLGNLGQGQTSPPAMVLHLELVHKVHLCVTDRLYKIPFLFLIFIYLFIFAGVEMRLQSASL